VGGSGATVGYVVEGGVKPNFCPVVQCAAVRTRFSWMAVPPQNAVLSSFKRATYEPYAFFGAFSPPMIRLARDEVAVR